MTTTVTTLDPHVRPRVWARARTGVLAIWAGVTGAAPHVLHHVGPLAGTAIVAGAGGRIVFGAAGFVATIPMLGRLRRRTGSWRGPGLALAAFAAVFTFSTLVIGPAVSGAGTDVDSPALIEDVDHHGHDDPTDAP
ncbi:MAG TPA: hypothetical protein VGA36_07365 [Nitriliruptorales bacterium]